MPDELLQFPPWIPDEPITWDVAAFGEAQRSWCRVHGLEWDDRAIQAGASPLARRRPHPAPGREGQRTFRRASTSRAVVRAEGLDLSVVATVGARPWAESRVVVDEDGHHVIRGER